MKNLTYKLVSLLASRKFFYAVLTFFVLEALWISLSAVYPMAFDEDFHFGIIKIYAHHWLPFLQSQPEDANAFGAVARDPSYLYHYLMSFPYRIIASVVDSQTTQVIMLRLINVVLFAGGLVLLRRVMRCVGISHAFIHLSLLVFVLIPIVPQLAGQVNYDNLLIPLVAGSCLLCLRVFDDLKERQLNARLLAQLLMLCLIASLVKYAFLPIFAAIVLFVGLLAWWYFRTDATVLWHRLRQSWSTLSAFSRILLVVGLVLCGGLFTQRYGVNMVRYHTPIPDCDRVLSAEPCSAYGPWNRNHLLAQTKVDTAFSHNPLRYTASWFYGLWYRLFFAVNGPASTYTNYPPLPFPAWTFAALTGLGTLAVLVFWRRVFTGNMPLQFFLAVILFYSGALWFEDYSQYLATGQAVAINGRYLLPVLLFGAAIAAPALQAVFFRKQRLRLFAAAAAIFFMFQGGGVFTFIARSDASWDWPNAAVIRANDTARHILLPVIFEGSKSCSQRFIC